MFKEPAALIDDAISSLRSVAELLQDEFDTQIHGVAQLSPEGKLAKSVHQSINILLPKLKAARLLQMHPEQRSGPPVCLDCD
jgi:hypothetical protein